MTYEEAAARYKDYNWYRKEGTEITRERLIADGWTNDGHPYRWYKQGVLLYGWPDSEMLPSMGLKNSFYLVRMSINVRFMEDVRSCLEIFQAWLKHFTELQGEDIKINLPQEE